MSRSAVGILAAIAMTVSLGSVAQAAEMMPCASADEVRGFTLRHLQSRLMVAALSCNQKEAYNSFVSQFIGDLGAGGKALVAYFERTGGGAPALNRHVTDLANAAGLHRASDPTGFCAATWHMFWELQQKPDMLVDIAGQNLIPAVAAPQACVTPSQTLTNAAASVRSKAAPPQEASLKP